MEQAIVTGWEAEAKALRQQVVELLGQQKLSVFSRVAVSTGCSHRRSRKGGAGMGRQTTSLRRRSSIFSHFLEESLCTKQLELGDVLEMGDLLIVSELTQLLAAGGAKVQAMSGAT